MWPSMRRLQASTMKRLRSACAKLLPADEAEPATVAAETHLERRVQELATDPVRAACTAHPYNVLKAREEQGPTGPYHRVMREVKPAF